MILKHSHCLVFSPPFAMILRGYADLVDAGHGPAEIPFTNTMPVIWVEDENRVVMGAAVYATDKTKRAGYQIFTIVLPEHRRKGLFKMMTQEVMRRTKEEGADRLFQSVHQDNEARLKSQPKGSKLSVTRYEIALE